MSSSKSIIDFKEINDMLDNDPAALREFSEAAIESFSIFREEFKEHMLNRDLPNLRKSGHRIKPVAQMLGLQQLIDEYEKAKKILSENDIEEKIKASIKRVEALCEQILNEFRKKID